MRLLKKIILTCLVSGITYLYGQERGFEVKWNYSSEYNGKDNLGLQLTLINHSPTSFKLSDYALWFNSMYPIKEGKFSGYTIHNRNGNLYSIHFQGYNSLPAKDSLIIDYQSPYPIGFISLVPNGFYLQKQNERKTVIAINDVKISAPKLTSAEQNAFLTALYEKNQSRLSLGVAEKNEKQLILPTPMSLKEGNGGFEMPSSVYYYVDPAFVMDIFKDFAKSLKQFEFVKGVRENSKIKILLNRDLAQEEYLLDINSSGITIQASSGAGAFYAFQSIKSLMSAKQLAAKGKVILPFLEVHDKPRYAYRGLMLDIARNFKSKEVILKYLDLMSLYKINTLHLHFIDDEGWRLEIPSLPELTEFGSLRTPYFADGNSLQPAYGSGVKETKGHFLTKADFLEILRYAAKRYINVIPEIETPGHARAAIKAMEHRYNRLMGEGKKELAEEYLLYDSEDNSEYSSAQYWNDNVLNPAMPSVYHFLDVVISEIQAMYKEAGLTLTRISLGGDEVPSGVWEKSPKVKQLMAKEGFTTVYEVWPYYVDKIQKLCASKGLQLAGWEEIGMVNQGKGMVVNPALANRNMLLDVWNNVIGGGHEDLVYKLANAGYKTIFTSGANYYLDMVWDKSFQEPGLKWASITDLYQSFSLLPESFFANMRFTEAGAELKPSYIQAKTRLTPEGRKNIIGLKAALWQETVLTDDRVDYMLLPRLFALAERAWRPAYSWEQGDEFDKIAFTKSYASFAAKVGKRELPKMDSFHGGFMYRLPSVGVKKVGNRLKANVEYPGFTIHYTEDGSKPSAKSKIIPKYGLKIIPGKKVKFAAVSLNGRVGRVSEYQN